MCAYICDFVLKYDLPLSSSHYWQFSEIGGYYFATSVLAYAERTGKLKDACLSSLIASNYDK